MSGDTFYFEDFFKQQKKSKKKLSPNTVLRINLVTVSHSVTYGYLLGA
jgi:hypothetical protein